MPKGNLFATYVHLHTSIKKQAIYSKMEALNNF